MPAFVVDVSACMRWCCEDEATPETERLLQMAAVLEPLLVPSLWPWEMMNALAVAVRRKRMDAAKAGRFLSLLAGFDFRIAESPGVDDLPRLSQLAARYGLTAYDVSYLDLARRLALPLASLDEALKKAAVAEGVVVL